MDDAPPLRQMAPDVMDVLAAAGHLIDHGCVELGNWLYQNYWTVSVVNTPMADPDDDAQTIHTVSGSSHSDWIEISADWYYSADIHQLAWLLKHEMGHAISHEADNELDRNSSYDDACF